MKSAEEWVQIAVADDHCDCRRCKGRTRRLARAIQRDAIQSAARTAADVPFNLERQRDWPVLFSAMNESARIAANLVAQTCAFEIRAVLPEEVGDE